MKYSSVLDVLKGKQVVVITNIIVADAGNANTRLIIKGIFNRGDDRVIELSNTTQINPSFEKETVSLLEFIETGNVKSIRQSK